MSCGQIALTNLGIKNYTYYASEINPYSIKITQKNYSNTIQLGDVTLLSEEKLKDLGSIDLLIFGSPCEDLSITKSKVRESLNGSKSKLFYEGLRIMNIVNPIYFMLENVASMNEESKNVITNHMGG